MDRAIHSAAMAVEQMDRHLRDELLQKDRAVPSGKLWENTYIKRQLEKRQAGSVFSTSDHIRAMVYSMLSSGIVWDRVADHIDGTTKQLTSVDEIFCQYAPERLLQCAPEQLSEQIKKLHCASQYTTKSPCLYGSTINETNSGCGSVLQ